MRHTKIFMTVDPGSEVWIYALDLCRALGVWNCDISLATTGRFLTAGQLRAAAQIPNVQLYESAGKLEWLEQPGTAAEQAGAWLLDLAQATRPDVIHLNSYLHGPLPWPAPVLVASHSGILSWWPAVKGKTDINEWETYRQRVSEGLHSAELVVAPTQARLALLQQVIGPLPNTSVIHPGRRQIPFAPERKENFIFTVGRLGDEATNLRALAAIAPRLALAERGWSIYVGGIQKRLADGPQQPQGLQWLGDLLTAQRAGWLARAAIYALPARYAPLGLSVIEAAFSGCALVLGDIPELCEVWQEAALYAAPNDHDALAATLTRVMADPKLRDGLAAAARKRAESFTANRMAAAYWSVYRSLIANPSAGKLLTCQSYSTPQATALAA